MVGTARCAVRTPLPCGRPYPAMGGACARMLRCKTSSANEDRPGGPVSRGRARNAIRGVGATKAGAKSICPRKSSLTAEPPANFSAVARKFLQHVEEGGVFGLAGVDCLAWSKHSWQAGATFGVAATATSAQWFEMASQAAIMTAIKKIESILGARLTIGSSSKRENLQYFPWAQGLDRRLNGSALCSILGV